RPFVGVLSVGSPGSVDSPAAVLEDDAAAASSSRSSTVGVGGAGTGATSTTTGGGGATGSVFTTSAQASFLAGGDLAPASCSTTPTTRAGRATPPSSAICTCAPTGSGASCSTNRTPPASVHLARVATFSPRTVTSTNRVPSDMGATLSQVRLT